MQYVNLLNWALRTLNPSNWWGEGEGEGWVEVETVRYGNFLLSMLKQMTHTEEKEAVKCSTHSEKETRDGEPLSGREIDKTYFDAFSD